MSFLFVLDPGLGFWATGILLVLAGAALIGEAIATLPRERWGRRVALRGLLWLVLAVWLLRPTRLDSEAQTVEPTLAVVLDSSGSMALDPAASGGRSAGAGATVRRGAPRYAAGERLLPTLAAGLHELPGRHEAWTIDDSLHRMTIAPEALQIWPRCAGGSALADGLEALIDGAAPAAPGARCDAVILFTDGAITRGRGWKDMLDAIDPSPAPVYVFGLGAPDDVAASAFTLDRIAGPEQVNAGEEARYSVAVRAPDGFSGSATLRLHWSVEGAELAMHELPAPQHGGLLTDSIAVPCPDTGLFRLAVRVDGPADGSADGPADGPRTAPPSTSRLIDVTARKIRVLDWSMRLTRGTRSIETALGRDGVLAVDVADDFARGSPMAVDNALRTTDVLVWEDPDLDRLPAGTLQTVEGRLQDGMGLVLLSAPRMRPERSGVLLRLLPTQAGAPWQAVHSQPVAPAETRSGSFWRGENPVLPHLDGRVQGFDPARDAAGFAPVVTTAEGRAVVLAAHPGQGGGVVVILTPDWPGDEAAKQANPPALGVGGLVRRSVHWVAGLDAAPSRPALHLKLADDRPLPDQPVPGAVLLSNASLPDEAAARTSLKLELVAAGAAPHTAGGAAIGKEPAAGSGRGATPIAWQVVNGQATFQLSIGTPGSYLLTGSLTTPDGVLTDRVPVYVPGTELEATTPPDPADLKLVADATGGRYIAAAQAQPQDLQAVLAALKSRLTAQPMVQVGRTPLAGGAGTALAAIVCLLAEMALRARRQW